MADNFDLTEQSDGVREPTPDAIEWPVPNERHVEALRSWKDQPGALDDFDRKFGPGSSSKHLGIGTSPLAEKIERDGTLDKAEAGSMRERIDADTERMKAATKDPTPGIGGSSWGFLPDDDPSDASVIDKIGHALLGTARTKTEWKEAEAKDVAKDKARIDDVRARTKSGAETLSRLFGDGVGEAIAGAKVNVLGAKKTADDDTIEAKGERDLAERRANLDRVQSGQDTAPLKTGWRAGLEGAASAVVDVLPAAAAKTIGIAYGSARWAMGSQDKIDDNLAYSLGEWITAKGKELFPGDERRQPEFAQKLAQGAGSMMGFMAPGVVAQRLLGASDKVLVGLVAVTGSAAEGASTFEDATRSQTKGEKGEGPQIAEWQRFSAWVAGLGLGATEAAPIASMLKRRGGSYFGAVAREAGEEGLQEFGQAIGEDVTALALHDPTRRVGENALEQAAIGTILGGTMQAGRLAMSSAARRQIRDETEPKAEPTQTQAERFDRARVDAAQPELAAMAKRTDEEKAPGESQKQPTPQFTPEAKAAMDGIREIIGEPKLFTEKSGQTSLVPEVTDRDRLAVEAAKPLRGGNAPLDVGLFGSGSQQIDLEDMLAKVKQAEGQQSAPEARPSPQAQSPQPTETASPGPVATRETASQGPTEAQREAFAKVLASKTVRKDWAKAARVDEPTLKALMDEAVTDGRLNANYRRTKAAAVRTKAEQSANAAPLGRVDAENKPVMSANSAQPAPVLDRATEKRLDAVASPVARRYALDLIRAERDPAAFAALVSKMKADKAVTKAVLDEAVSAYAGTKKAKTKAAAFEALAAAQTRRASEPAATADQPKLPNPKSAKRVLDAEPKPVSLVEFLRSRGGVRDAEGDLKAMGAIKQRPGLVNNKSGMDLDTAREIAVEAGYIADIATVLGDEQATSSTNDLLDAISEELGGRKVYRPDDRARIDAKQDAERATVERQRIIDELTAFHDENGLPFDMTEREIEYAGSLIAQGTDIDTAVESAYLQSARESIDNETDGGRAPQAGGDIATESLERSFDDGAVAVRDVGGEGRGAGETRGEGVNQALMDKGRDKARAHVLRLGKQHNREYGAMVLPDGSMKANRVPTGARKVDFLMVNQETAPELFNGEPRSVDFHHNHPRSTSFSRADYTEAAIRPALRRTYVHGHDGSQYWAELLYDSETLGAAYGLARTATEGVTETGIGMPRYRTHLVAEMMREAGVIRYDAELAPADAQERIADLKERMGDVWGEAVALIETLKRVGDVLDHRAGPDGLVGRVDGTSAGVDGVGSGLAGSESRSEGSAAGSGSPRIDIDALARDVAGRNRKAALAAVAESYGLALPDAALARTLAEIRSAIVDLARVENATRAQVSAAETPSRDGAEKAFPTASEVIAKRPTAGLKMAMGRFERDAIYRRQMGATLADGHKFQIDTSTADFMRQWVQQSPRIIPQEVAIRWMSAAVQTPTGSIKALFEGSDGSVEEIEFAKRNDFLSARGFFKRAGWDGPGFIGFVVPHLSTHDGFVSLDRELWHEAIHALRALGLISDGDFRLLVAHANALGIMDLTFGDFLSAAKGQEYTGSDASTTLKDIYSRAYANRGNVHDLIDEEAVAHMTELLVSGVDLPIPEDIRQILERIETGEMAGRTTPPAVSALRNHHVAAIAKIDGALTQGQAFDVNATDVETALAAVRTDRAIMPKGSVLGVLSRVEPHPVHAGHVIASLSDHDGKIRTVTLPWSRLRESGAVFLSGRRPVILIVHLGQATAQGEVGLEVGGGRVETSLDEVAQMRRVVVDALRADLRHELVHLLRATRALDGADWRNLVSHANALGMLELDADASASERVLLRELGIKPTRTLRTAYREMYANYGNVQELIDQEAVAALIEQVWLGTLSRDQIAPVQTLVENIIGGRVPVPAPTAKRGGPLYAIGSAPISLDEKIDNIQEAQKALEALPRKGRRSLNAEFDVLTYPSVGRAVYYVVRKGQPLEDRGGNIISVARFDVKPAQRMDVSGVEVTNARVEVEYQRKGIASAVYDMVERDMQSVGGLSPSPRDQLSPDAVVFWSKRLPGMMFAMGGHFSKETAERKAIATHFGATRIETIGENDPHPGRVLAYHGTSARFIERGEKFDVERSADFGMHFGTPDQATRRLGYDNPALWQYAEGERVIPVVIDASRVVDLPDLHTWPVLDTAQALEDRVPELAGLVEDIEAAEADGRAVGDEIMRRRLTEAGIDAIRYKNATEGSGWSYIVWQEGKVIAPFTGEPLMAIGPSEAGRQSLLRLKMGLDAYAPAENAGIVFDAIRPMRAAIPDDIDVGVLDRIEPTGRKRGLTYVFRLEDGSERSLPVDLTVDDVGGMRAGFIDLGASGGRNLIGFFRLHTPDNLGQISGGEAWHELTHALARLGIEDGDRDRLVAHAQSLTVLDRPLLDHLLLIGDDAALDSPPDVSIRQTYEYLYASRPNIKSLMDEESIAHMAEMAYHGGLSEQDLAPVRDLLDKHFPGLMAQVEAKQREIREAKLSGGLKEGIVERGQMMFAMGPQPSEIAEDIGTGQSMRRDLDTLGYYSQALEAAKSLKQAKGTPGQMLAMLKAAGVKDAEIEATGLATLFKEKAGSTTALESDAITLSQNPQQDGFDTKTVWYRGDKREWEGVDSDEANPDFPRAMYLTTDPALASYFTHGAEGSRVGKFHLRDRNLFDFRKPEHVEPLIEHINAKGRSIYPGFLGGMSMITDGARNGDWGILELDQVQQWLKDKGFPGWYAQEGPGKKLTVAVFDEADVRPATPQQQGDRTASPPRRARLNQISKSEIVKYLEENRVGLREVAYRDPSPADDAAWAGQLEAEGTKRGGDVGEELIDLAAAVRSGDITGRDFQIGVDNAGLLPETANVVKQTAKAAGITSDPVKWSDYSLDPSNPTYRETVIHLPGSDKDAMIARLEAKYGPHYQKQMTAEERNALDAASGEERMFRSGHFPEPNIVGHMMTSMTKHEGKPVYTIDQIQSDWGQKLRDGGVRDEAKINELARNLEKARASRDKVFAEANAFVSIHGGSNPRHTDDGIRLASALGAIKSGDARRVDNKVVHPDEAMKNAALEYLVRVNRERSAVDLIEAELRTANASTPGHPLVNTTDQWTNTTLRRAIRQAAEADAEYIAIPHGDTVLSYNPGDEGGMQGFYGSRASEGIVPKNLRKLLEKLDKDSPRPVKVEALDTPSGKRGYRDDTGNSFDKNQTGFTLFPLTDKVKRSVTTGGQVMFAFGPFRSNRQAKSIAEAEDTFKDAIGLTTDQGLKGMEIEYRAADAEGNATVDRTLEIHPADGRARSRSMYGNTWVGRGTHRVISQYDRQGGIARGRSSRNLNATVHEGAHHLVDVIGAPLLDLIDAHQGELSLVAASADLNTPVEHFAEWFRHYVTDRAYANRVAPKFLEAFEDLMDAELPGSVAEIDKATGKINAYMLLNPLERQAADLVSGARMNWVEEMHRSYRTGNLGHDVSMALTNIYTSYVASSNTVWHIVSRILRKDDARKIQEGRPEDRITLAKIDDPWVKFKMLPGAYKRGHNWLTQGVQDPTTHAPIAPPMRDAIVKIMGEAKGGTIASSLGAVAAAGTALALGGGVTGALIGGVLASHAVYRALNVGHWNTTAWNEFGAYVAAVCKMERWTQLEAKQDELRQMKDTLGRATAARPAIVKSADETEAKLERRQTAMVRLRAILQVRRRELGSAETALQNAQERIGDISEAITESQAAIDDGSDVAKADKKRQNRSLVRANQKSAELVRRVQQMQTDVDEMEVLEASLSNEIAQLEDMASTSRKRVSMLDDYLARVRTEIGAREKRGASKPPGKEAKAELADAIAKAEAKYPQIKDAMVTLHQFMEGVLEAEYRAGRWTKEQYELFKSQSRWYAPLMRDMSDIPEVRDVSRVAARRFREMQKYVGSDRDIYNPLDMIIERAYQSSFAIAQNDFMLSLVNLVRGVDGGVAEIAEEVRPEQTLFGDPATLERLKASLRELTQDEHEAEMLFRMLEHDLPNSDFSLIRTPSGKVPKAGIKLPFYENGERRMLKINDVDFAAELYERVNGLGMELGNVLTTVLTKGERLFAAGATMAPAFAVVNLVRDTFAAFAYARAVPIVTQARGIELELSTWSGWKEIAPRLPQVIQDRLAENQRLVRRYHDAGGIRGGQFTSFMGETKDQGDWQKLRHTGLAYGGKFWEVIELAETANRLGVFSALRKRDLRRGMTEDEAIADAAFRVRDLMDFDERGSRYVSVMRMIAFLNPAIRDIDKQIRELTGSTYRGLAVPAAMQKAIKVVMKRDAGAPLTEEERQALPRALAFYSSMVAITLFFVGLHMLYADDDEIQEVDDRKRALGEPIRANGEVRMIPKPHGLAAPANTIIELMRSWGKDDPATFERIRRSLYDVYALPVIPQTLRGAMNTVANYDPWRNRPIVSKEMQELHPALQYDEWTSNLSRQLGQKLDISPIKLDYWIRSQFATLGREAQRLSEFFPGGRPKPGDLEDPIVKRVTANPYANANAAAEVYREMRGESGGGPVAIIGDFIFGTAQSYKQSEASYRRMLGDQGEGLLKAKQWVQKTLPEEYRAYAYLMGHFGPKSLKDAESFVQGDSGELIAQTREPGDAAMVDAFKSYKQMKAAWRNAMVHPLNRLDVVARTLNQLKMQVLQDEINTGSARNPELVKLSRGDKDLAIQTLGQIFVAEARNAFIAMDHGVWKGEKPMPIDDMLDVLKAISPTVHDQLMERLTKKQIPTMDSTIRAWKAAKPALLQRQEEADEDGELSAAVGLLEYPDLPLGGRERRDVPKPKELKATFPNADRKSAVDHALDAAGVR